MSHRVSFLVLSATVLAGLALYTSAEACRRARYVAAQAPAAKQPVAKQPVAKQDADPKSEAAKKAVLANVQTFTDAFNRRDVMTLLTLFADDCELTEHDGTTIRGLKELEKELKESFEDDPDARLSVSVDLLRVVTPDVVIEEGKTMYFPDGKTLTAETDYQATHVRKGDRWVMSRVRSFNRVVLSPYDRLRELEWLVGDWIDEGSDSLVKSSYRWDGDKTFLLQDFSVQVKGKDLLKGNAAHRLGPAHQANQGLGLRFAGRLLRKPVELGRR